MPFGQYLAEANLNISENYAFPKQISTQQKYPNFTWLVKFNDCYVKRLITKLHPELDYQVGQVAACRKSVSKVYACIGSSLSG